MDVCHPGLAFACVMPHGAELIPELAEANVRASEEFPSGPLAAVPGAAPAVDREALVGFARLAAALEQAGSRLRAVQPDTVVIASPHSLRLEGGYHAVVTSQSVRGELAVRAASAREASAPPGEVEALPGEVGAPGGEVEALAGEAGAPLALVRAAFPCDQALARRIVAEAGRAGLGVVGVNFGSAGGPASSVEMDWGTLVPLYFIGRRERTGKGQVVEVSAGPWETSPRPRPAIVLIGPSRDVGRAELVRLGEIVVGAAAGEGRRIAFVASADQGHAHQEVGPYGLSPASAVYDSLICDIVGSGNPAEFERLLEVDPALVDEAKPDSLWQMLILLGVLRAAARQGSRWLGEFLGYEVPTYFGMLVASYAPERQRGQA